MYCKLCWSDDLHQTLRLIFIALPASDSPGSLTCRFQNADGVQRHQGLLSLPPQSLKRRECFWDMSVERNNKYPVPNRHRPRISVRPSQARGSPAVQACGSPTHLAGFLFDLSAVCVAAVT